ncbi:HTH domain-containing protein [Vibrio harveyi]|uniref:HTH domain-containing protein n=1 Tax=Vibrio harveyi TaxID=669 RepID=UPI00234D70FA|nr:HTH domain-containing protein [Vibrio harveyi]WCP80770.1 HTH domain-containing protein [Vibrio harveyi]WCP80774.1 HTH domain-containing protein [Vibrio harveyi]HDM8159727.1 HTH domain-containing protein [Vibrio harveyi]
MNTKGEFSEQDNLFIIQNFTSMTQVEIAQYLNRSNTCIYNRIRKLKKQGLLSSSPFNGVPYTSDEDVFIISNRGILSFEQVAKTLGRSSSSVSDRARKLGVSYTKIGTESPVAKLTSDDVELIRELALDLTHLDIASKFDVSRSQVSRIINFESRLYTNVREFSSQKQRQCSAIDGLN